MYKKSVKVYPFGGNAVNSTGPESATRQLENGVISPNNERIRVRLDAINCV